MDFIIFSIFYLESFLLLVSNNFDTCAYICPKSQEIANKPTIPRSIVTAEIPASFGP